MQLAAAVLGIALLGQAASDPPPATLPGATRLRAVPQAQASPGVMSPSAPPATVAEPSPPVATPEKPGVGAGRRTDEDTRAVPAVVPANEGRSPPGHLRLTPPELVAEALNLPAGSTLTGRPLALLTVVSTARDQRQQFEVVHAYWRLAEAVAEYRFCLDQESQLGRLRAGLEEAGELRAAQAAAAAGVREAEIEAVAAQHELASLVMLPLDSPLPLPADRPHVGAYRTHFAELFSTRPSPDRAKLIDRTLPIRQRAIEGHAVAVQAAEEAVEAAVDAAASGRGRLSTVLACLGEHLRQRRALMTSVCHYNHDIADYAMAVAAPQAAAEALVGMLIKQERETIQPVASGEGGGAQPASFNAPMAAPVAAPVPGKNWPTRAVRPAAPAVNEPTPAPPRDAPLSPVKQEPTLAPPRENPESSTPKPSERPLVPVRPQTGAATSREARKPIAEEATGVRSTGFSRNPVEAPPEGGTTNSARQAAGSIYPGLMDLAPAGRAKQLATALHWDRSLPQDAGQPIRLDECLRAAQTTDRRAVLDAFWVARRRAAQYQSLGQQAEWLADIASAPADHGPQAADPGAILQVRTIRLATEAAKMEAHAALLEAEFDLARQIGQTAATAWPLPSTPPHSGPFPLIQAAQASPAGGSWALRRLTATIPRMRESIEQRGTAVCEADSARTAAAADFQAGRQPAERVLAAINGQSEQTFAFLQSLADYNQAMAHYAIQVLPPGVPAETLAAALIASQ